MEFEIIFFADKKGNKPVEEFLENIFRRNRLLWARTVAGLEKIKNRAYHREPLSRAISSGLWEIRIKSGNNILRVIYTFTKGRKIILLHRFIKKTQKIPKTELNVARQRLKQLGKGSI